jgi:hypothetical protein
MENAMTVPIVPLFGLNITEKPYQVSTNISKNITIHKPRDRDLGPRGRP